MCGGAVYNALRQKNPAPYISAADFILHYTAAALCEPGADVQVENGGQQIVRVDVEGSGVSVVLEGNIIDLGVDKLQVADACSGLRYFMPMILMALLVAYFFVKGRWRWTVLLLLIVPLSVFINAVRIWISALLTASGIQNLHKAFSMTFPAG